MPSEELNKYRSIQRRVALYRDDGCCVWCAKVDRKLTPAVDVHHVYGRGVKIGSEKEVYTSLLSLCRKHHIMVDAEKSSERVVELLRRANDNPINHYFRHEGIRV